MAKGRPEIDKEAMFRKIMPSSFSAPGEEEGVPAPAAPHNPLSPPAPVSQLTQPPSPPQAAGSPPAGGPAALVGGGVQLRRTAGARILVNIMEYLVIDKLDEAYEKFNNCCKCDKCRQDAAALALNKLKPKYIVVEERQIPYQIAKNNSPEVTSSIVKAILQVKAHPQH